MELNGHLNWGVLRLAAVALASRFDLLVGCAYNRRITDEGLWSQEEVLAAQRSLLGVVVSKGVLGALVGSQLQI